MSARNTKTLLGSALLLLFWGLIAWRLMVLQQPAEPLGQGVAEDHELFDQALAAGLLVARDNGELQPLPRDEMLARSQAGNAVDAATRRLFSRLHNSLAGTAVRAELNRWNRTRSLAAVRDNSGAFSDVSHSGWTAYDCDGGQRALGGVVPEAYGFLHQGRLHAGFGPWQVAAGRGCVEFRTRFFAPQPRALDVWMVGQPEDLRALTTVTPLKPPKTRPCGSVEVPTAAKMAITPSSWKRVPSATQSAADSGWQRELRVRLRPANFRGDRIAGVKLAIDPQNCRYVWLDAGAGGRAGRRSGGVGQSGPLLLSSDGVGLLQPDGRPSDAARELGLLPVVGYGRGDFHSLSSLLARSRLPTGFVTRLTLDTRLQRAAQQQLQQGVDRLFPPAQDRYALQRRAAMVVLNARSGAIVAAAGLPRVPMDGHLEDWDLAAFARVYPAHDPLRVRAWDSAQDKHNAPGSTLKPVTALAALAKAGVDTTVDGMLQGWNPREFSARTGLTIATTGYNPYAGVAAGSPDGRRRRLSNFRLAGGRRESFQTLLNHPTLNAPECSGTGSRVRPLGLPSAVRDSLNVWFARLAMLVDGEAMDQLDRLQPGQRPDPASRFTQTLRTLGFDRTLDLLAAAPAFIADAGRPRLPPAQVSLWAENPRPARWVLAQNAIGQGVSVATLHMARVAASIAAGRVIQPHLVADWNGQLVIPPTGPILAGDLDLLRTGMRAVPQVGTAKRAFAAVFADRLDSPLRCNTYAKTGTAEVAPDPVPGAGNEARVAAFNSAWLIGWHQPADGDPLAFACMVSHAHGRGSTTGGQVCAPIVARFLAQVYPVDDSEATAVDAAATPTSAPATTARATP